MHIDVSIDVFFVGDFEFHFLIYFRESKTHKLPADSCYVLLCSIQFDGQNEFSKEIKRQREGESV